MSTDEKTKHLRQNYLLQVISGTATRVGDELTNAKVVLPWLLHAAGAPTFIIGLLVPVRESLSMLPQLFIDGVVRTRTRRKGFWVLGAVGQGLAVWLMAVAGLALTGAPAGWSVLLLLAVFALGRGFCSISSKDVLGKTIPKGKRGSLLGLRSSIAGLLTVGLGLALSSGLSSGHSPRLYALLLGSAGLLWFFAALLFSMIREPEGTAVPRSHAMADAWRRLDLLRTDAAFRRFVTARALLMSTALVAPFYVALAREQTGSTASTLGMLVVASGLAGAASSFVWGRLADLSSRRVLGVAGLMAGSIGLFLFLSTYWEHPVVKNPFFYAIMFLLLGVSHSGVRLGRKTYVLDLATEETRSTYVAVSNTLIGLLLLVAGALTAPLAGIGSAGMVLVMAILSLLGAVLSFRLQST